tara:strand:+ start:83 stop:568 length:486 start_codon:yes stop_codon:yes gene_type:complete
MIIKNLGKNFTINLFLILLIFLLDRISKIYVIYLDKKLPGSEIFSSRYLNIQLIWNEGVAFGLFSFDDKFFYNLLTGLIIIISAVIIYFIVNTKGIERYAFTIIFGGSIGNIFDRLVYSSVPDFIDVHYENFHWFIFNVADIFITFGVLILITFELILKKK